MSKKTRRQYEVVRVATCALVALTVTLAVAEGNYVAAFGIVAALWCGFGVGRMK